MSSSSRPSNAQRFVAQSVSPVSVHSCLEQLNEQLIKLQVPRGGATIDSSEHASYMYTQDIIFNGNLHARVSKSSARYHTSSRKSNILSCDHRAAWRLAQHSTQTACATLTRLRLSWLAV